MEQLLISVETFIQREKIVKILESAENEGELDFPFDLWKLHHRKYRDPLNPDVTAWHERTTRTPNTQELGGTYLKTP